MKNNKSFVGKLISLASIGYVVYVALKEKGYWDEFKEKLKEEKDKWKEKYNESVVDNDWYTVDAEDILRQRFASGEIDQDEFEMRMKILRR